MVDAESKEQLHESQHGHDGGVAVARNPQWFQDLDENQQEAFRMMFRSAYKLERNGRQMAAVRQSRIWRFSKRMPATTARASVIV